MRRAPWLALIVLAVAGCSAPAPAGGDDPGPAPPVPYDAWASKLSEPRYSDIVRESSFLRSKDGTSLAITVWRPKDAGTATLPTLLQITPYQTIDRAVMATFGEEPTTFWPKRGVVFALADARGTHSSGGCLDFGGFRDREDARAFAQWIQAQPWSNGTIAVEGVSHPGMGALVASVADVPGLVASLAHAPVSSYYMDEWENGARFEGQNNGAAYQAIETLPTLDPSPEAIANQAGGTCQGETLREFTINDGTLTPWFKDKDLNLLAKDVRKPILLTIGFFDMNVFPTHVERFWRALPEDVDARLVLGYWTHSYPDLGGYTTPEWADWQHRYLDTVLLGRDTGFEREPRILVEDSTGAWHALAAWPPVNLTTLWPAKDGALSETPSGPGQASWRDDPSAHRDRWGPDAHVLFETEPLENPVWVAGAPRVTLVAKATASHVNHVVYLFDVAPDGTRVRVSHGYHDSRFPNGLERAAPPAPGTPATYAFDLFPTAHVLEKGHRLALVLASSDRSTTDGYTQCQRTPRGGCYDPSGLMPSPNPDAVTTALLGAEATRIDVPFADPALGHVG